MTIYNFQTPAPVKLYVELMSGEVSLRAIEAAETSITVEGKNPELVTVTQDGDEISVVGPKVRGLFNFDRGYDVTVALPVDSQIILKSGSTDLRAQGRLMAVQVKSGSGDVLLDEVSTLADVATGSGDFTLTSCHGRLSYKTGSGDLNAVTVHGPAKVTTGSGDVTIETPHDTVNVKTGSGDVRLGEVVADVTIHSGSSDVKVGPIRTGSLVHNTGSGDTRVVVAQGVPVWTDINTITGTIRSSLSGVGKPEPGQEHIEIRARSASGDITLVEA